MEKRVVLDDKSFKALSADSRINILKNLTDRRMTLSELSNKLSLKNSTIKEHCELLMSAELVKKVDEGRKWKYYELTQKGKTIIEPNPFDEIKILVTLSVSAIIISIVILSLMQGVILNNPLNNLTSNSFLQQNQDFSIMSDTELAMVGAMREPGVEKNFLDETTTLTGVNYNIYAISIITTLIIGLFAGWLVSRKI